MQSVEWVWHRLSKAREFRVWRCHNVSWTKARDKDVKQFISEFLQQGYIDS